MSLSAKHLHNFLLQHSYTLSIAESITGGKAASELVQQPGASHYFVGSLTAYSNRIKTEVLGIDINLIKKDGAVSSDVVRAMALGAQKLFKTDLALSTSGVAGPMGGSLEKPIGLVWFSFAFRDETVTWSEHLKGSRENIINQSVEVLFSKSLNLLINI